MSLFSPFSWHLYICASMCGYLSVRAHMYVCLPSCTSAQLHMILWSLFCHAWLSPTPWPPTSTELWPHTFLPRPLLLLLSVLSSLPSPSLSSSLSLSFVYLLMCEIILGWRDGFLPEGLSRGVSLLFNNRLGVYVYLSMVIDYRLVLDNKPLSGGQTDGRVCFIHPSGVTCLVSVKSLERWNKEATKLSWI